MSAIYLINRELFSIKRSSHVLTNFSTNLSGWRKHSATAAIISPWIDDGEDMMAMQRSKMICPRCRAEMNYHAEKLIDPVKPEDSKHVNPALGGVVKEMHACPKCGAV